MSTATAGLSGIGTGGNRDRKRQRVLFANERDARRQNITWARAPSVRTGIKGDHDSIIQHDTSLPCAWRLRQRGVKIQILGLVRCRA